MQHQSHTMYSLLYYIVKLNQAGKYVEGERMKKLGIFNTLFIYVHRNKKQFISAYFRISKTGLWYVHCINLTYEVRSMNSNYECLYVLPNARYFHMLQGWRKSFYAFLNLPGSFINKYVCIPIQLNQQLCSMETINRTFNFSKA